MSKPLWQALCEAWVEDGLGNTGLTVPFLLIATQHDVAAVPGPKLDLGSLARLLYELQSQCPKDHCVRIELCGTPKKPVVKVTKLSGVQSTKELVKAQKGDSRLYVSQTYPHDGTIDSAAQALWDIVGESISSEAYSFDAGKFRPLNDDERAFIKRVRHAA